MKRHKNGVLSRDESFFNAVFYFIETLEVASQSAEDQCDYYDNFNVAWELLDELSNINYLIENFPNKFTEEELVTLNELSKVIESVPTSVLAEAKTREENLHSMKKTVWEPIRKQASTAKEVLKKIDIWQLHHKL